MKKPQHNPDGDALDERKGPAVTVTASESRFRAGRRWPKGVAVEIDPSEFTEDELKAIATDPVLSIAPKD